MKKSKYLKLMAKKVSESDAAGMSDAVVELQTAINDYAGIPDMPVSKTKWVLLEQVESNDYNPNSVAKQELKLLQLSILSDGYTQPVVTFWDTELEKYVIVDGFHRYFCAKHNKTIHKMCGGQVPIVVIDADINGRMASTVRHNRARGKHAVSGMSNLVFQMLEGGMTDSEICNELGMEAEEIVKLKHLTGFSKLFKDVKYRQAWETSRQMKVMQDYEGKGVDDECVADRKA